MFEKYILNVSQNLPQGSTWLWDTPRYVVIAKRKEFENKMVTITVVIHLQI